MGALLFLSLILKIALRIYIYVLWARFIIELIRVFNPRFRPRGVFLVIVDVIFTITDPPIKMFRRLLPPIRLGTVMIDLGFMLTLLTCIIIVALLP